MANSGTITVLNPTATAMVVQITNDGDGAVAAAYTSATLGSAHTMPKTITATTDFWVPEGGYVVSVKINGVEVAANGGATRAVKLYHSQSVAFGPSIDQNMLTKYATAALQETTSLPTLSATTTVPLLVATAPLTITGARVCSATVVAANDSTYWTMDLKKYTAGSPDANTIASKHSKATAGAAIPALDNWTVDPTTLHATSKKLVAGDVLVAVFTKTSTPNPITTPVVVVSFIPS